MADREHYVRLRKSVLVDLLARELPKRDAREFRQFCELITAIFHFTFLDRLERLKDAYAPFDPDGDAAPDSKQDLDGLFREITSLMERANFRRLSHEELHAAVEGGSSDWGVNMEIDFEVFDRLEVFARGDTLGKRTRRRFKGWWWQHEEVEVPIFERLLLVLKLRPSPRLEKDVDTGHVYLKLFKDIPKLDLEMLLPGARLQMPFSQRLKLTGSLLSSVGFILWKVIIDMQTLVMGLLHRNPLVFWGPLSLACGYGYRQYTGYQSTRQSYSLMLTRSLFYQNLGNNQGVLTQLLDAAEEQECREAILAYFSLWREAGARGWTPLQLDDHVEELLQTKANLQVDFEVDDALDKLERLGLVQKIDDVYRAVPIAKALEKLDRRWDNFFTYNNEAQAESKRKSA